MNTTEDGLGKKKYEQLHLLVSLICEFKSVKKNTNKYGIAKNDFEGHCDGDKCIIVAQSCSAFSSYTDSTFSSIQL